MTDAPPSTSPTVPLFELRDVSSRFLLPSGQELSVLAGVNLSILPGEVIAIVGRSGSGKSTLLNLLGLLDVPTTGEMLFDGRDIGGMDDAERSRLRGRDLGFIFQQFHLLDGRTAIENVAEPLLMASRTEARHRMATAAALLGRVGLAERRLSLPQTLSGGEQQRVAIARALVRTPRMVLADEPTGSLDETTGAQVLDMLLGLARSRETALVIVTHDMDVARRADRIYRIRGGQLEGGLP